MYKKLNLADKRFHLQSNEHKHNKSMWYCEACKKDININFKDSDIKSATRIENEVISRVNNNLTDKTYTYINPDFEKVDNLIKRTFDECTQNFHRFKNKCEFVVYLIMQHMSVQTNLHYQKSLKIKMKKQIIK